MTTITMEKTDDYLVLKIPLKIMKGDNFKAPAVVGKTAESDLAISEGLRDIESGRVHGPFKSVREFKKSIIHRFMPRSMRKTGMSGKAE